MSTHRTLDGRWGDCEDTTCPLPFHFDLPLAEVGQIPEHIFEDLVASIDPPDDIRPYANMWTNEDGQAHRENGLPAVVYENGLRIWYHHGQKHRDRGLPAEEWPGGHKEWWEHGVYLRENDEPRQPGGPAPRRPT
jgi:hypothetical protein